MCAKPWSGAIAAKSIANATTLLRSSPRPGSGLNGFVNNLTLGALINGDFDNSPPSGTPGALVGLIKGDTVRKGGLAKPSSAKPPFRRPSPPTLARKPAPRPPTRSTRRPPPPGFASGAVRALQDTFVN